MTRLDGQVCADDLLERYLDGFEIVELITGEQTPVLYVPRTADDAWPWVIPETGMRFPASHLTSIEVQRKDRV